VDPLTSEACEAILREHGAECVNLQRRPYGRFIGLLAFFIYHGRAQVWRIRGDGYVQNFKRDVERELA
jgi:hypothetical protein